MAAGGVSMNAFKKIGAACSTVVLVSLWFAVAGAEEMAAPINVQAALFLKMFGFDRNLKGRAGNEIVIGIVYQRKFRTSLYAKNELMRVMEEAPVKEIGGVPISCASLDVSDLSDVGTVILESEADILYIAPLRSLAIEDITWISRARQKMTITGVPD